MHIVIYFRIKVTEKVGSHLLIIKQTLHSMLNCHAPSLLYVLAYIIRHPVYTSNTNHQTLDSKGSSQFQSILVIPMMIMVSCPFTVKEGTTKNLATINND